MIYKNCKIIFAFFICVLLTFTNANAEKYSLLNPVPKNKAREMTTERPTKSDSSHTIDSGHLQIETSLYAYDKTKNADSRTTHSSILNSTTFRLGITQNTELQIMTSPIIWQKKINYQNSSIQNKNGFGDTTLRFKYNFVGNDSGKFSIAAIPFIKIPTNSHNLFNNDTEGGISIPMDLILDNGFSFNYTIQNLILRRSDVSRYSSVFANMFVLGKSFNDKFSGYFEYYAEQLPEDTRYAKQTLDFALLYAISKNVMLDSAVNFGLSNRSPDLEIIFGGSYRF
jgi:hypothetical protein